ncbi:MAG TPA: hypothetical protein VOA87_12450 [Thermoanaerobaculia bacterium]|nr:hypothetical protein [Thermoanaerobaculia bacterium]
MTGDQRRAAVDYLRFLAWTAVLVTAIALLGWLPTRAWGGKGAVLAMAVGCGVGVLAAAAGGLPVALAAAGRGREKDRERFGAALQAMILRLVVALAAGVAATLSGKFARGPFLVWVAISYVALLAVDTRYTLGVLGRSSKRET